MRIAIFLSLLIFGCATQEPTQKAAENNSETKAQPGDIFVNENSTVIDGNEIPRASTFFNNVSKLMPHVQSLEEQKIQEVTIYVGPDTQSGNIQQIVYALGSIGYEHVKIQTCAGKATIYMPTLGFEPGVQIILEPQRIRIHQDGKDLPPQPPCSDPGATLCAEDHTQDLQALVKLVNNLLESSDSVPNVVVATAETTPSQELLDILQLFASESPAIRAPVLLAVTK